MHLLLRRRLKTSSFRPDGHGSVSYNANQALTIAINDDDANPLLGPSELKAYLQDPEGNFDTVTTRSVTCALPC
jgi:hypothetical protein